MIAGDSADRVIPSARDLERARAGGVPLSRRLLANRDLWGAIGSTNPKLVNRCLRSPVFRAFLQRVLGLDRAVALPVFAAQSFDRWFQKRVRGFRREIKGTGGRVAFFPGCRVNFLRP